METCVNDHPRRKGGTAPFLAALSVLLAATPMSAEEALRDAPPEGAVVHVAAQTTTTRDGKMVSEFKTTLEQRVTASQDGLKWEASINITHEEGQGLDKLSAAGLRDYLLAASAGRRTVYRAFMLVESATTQFTPPAKPDGSFVGADAGWVVRTSLDCPWDQFQRFFPIGQMPVVSMRCIRRSWLPKDDKPRELGAQILVADDGNAVAHAAAGDFPAWRIRVTEIDDNGTVSERVMLFSERLGVPLQSDTVRRTNGRAGEPAVVITDHVEVMPTQ